MRSGSHVLETQCAMRAFCRKVVQRGTKPSLKDLQLPTAASKTRVTHEREAPQEGLCPRPGEAFYVSDEVARASPAPKLEIRPWISR